MATSYPSLIGIMYTPKHQARYVRMRLVNRPDFRHDSNTASMLKDMKNEVSKARVDIYCVRGTKTVTKNFIKRKLNINANNSNNSDKNNSDFDYVSIYTSVDSLPTVVRALLNPSYRYQFMTSATYQILLMKSPIFSDLSFNVKTVSRRMRNLIHNHPGVGTYQRYQVLKNTLENYLKRDGNKLNARRIQAVARGMPARKEFRKHLYFKPGGPGYHNALSSFTLHQAASTPVKNKKNNNDL